MPYAETKQQAHELIERMAPGQLTAMVGLMEMLLDPVARTLANAPLDDEPVSEEERQDIAVVRASLSGGITVSHDEVLAEFGLTCGDFESMGRTALDPNDAGQ